MEKALQAKSVCQKTLNFLVEVLCILCAGNVQFVTGPDGQPTEAILYGTGAQATFQNTAGQVVVVTNNSPGTVSIPIDTDGDPSIPAGSNLSVVSTNPSIPSTPTSSSSGGYSQVVGVKILMDIYICILPFYPLLPPFSPCYDAAEADGLRLLMSGQCCAMWPNKVFTWVSCEQPEH